MPLKYKTVREGEQAVIYDDLGEGRLIIGPERVFMLQKRLQFLELHSASPEEFLVVEDLSGFIHHKKGPCQMFCNPLEVRSIKVSPAIMLNANQIIVVYKKLKDNSVERRLVEGPAVFVREAEEWLHDFVWHGEDPHTQGHMIPKSQTFRKLTVVASQFSYNVREVRTNDDTMLTVKIMLFYELNDIITMLEATHDPIADMINAVCADVISFAGRMSFPEFLHNSAQLSLLDSYPQLLQRAQRIGYKITKVVYRGYQASAQLQAMQDNAIQSRTQMRIQAELQEQKQRLTDFKLKCEQERTELRHDMERSKVEHKQKTERMTKAHDLALKQMQEKQRNEMASLMSEVKLEISAASDEEQQAYLAKLSNLSVDLTQYLTNLQQTAPDEEINVSNISNETKAFSPPPNPPQFQTVTNF